MLGIEDHGIMTFSLTMMFDGCGQGFGGYCFSGGHHRRDFEFDFR